MSNVVIVRYRTRPEVADENERLVKNVYAELAAEAPGEFHYATFRLADRVSFVHVAITDDAASPLAGLPAFQEFQRGVSARCVEPPVVLESTVVGSYRFLEIDTPADGAS